MDSAREGLYSDMVPDADVDRRPEPGQRFEVVGPDDDFRGKDLFEMTLRSMDGSAGEPRPGMELMLPDAANLKTFRGQPIEQVRSITLDGSRWIVIRQPSLSLPPGQGKVLSAEVTDAKRISTGEIIHGRDHSRRGLAYRRLRHRPMTRPQVRPVSWTRPQTEPTPRCPKCGGATVGYPYPYCPRCR